VLRVCVIETFLRLAKDSIVAFLPSSFLQKKPMCANILLF
jgi:hypothetical protein